MSASLSLLPFDILVATLSYVDPIDIVRLRMTCTMLRDVAKTQIVWINALKRSCDQDTLYAPSFPYSDLSAGQLERLALRPALFSRTVALKHRESQINPSSRRPGVGLLDTKHARRIPLKYPQTDPSFPASPHHSTYIIPGGRYILALTHGYLRLWDAGFSQDDPIEETPVAEVPWDLHTFHVARSANGDAIRVVGWGEPRSTVFYVYEIRPQDPSPSFKALGQIRNHVPAGLDYFSTCGDRLIMVYGDVVKIWDFMKDEWLLWNVGHRVFQILTCPTFLILLDNNGTDLTFWKLPEKMLPGAQLCCDEPWPEVPMVPFTRLSFAAELNHVFYVAGPCDWYSINPSLPQWFDTVDRVEDKGRTSYVFHQIEINNLASDTDGPPQVVQHPDITVKSDIYQEEFSVLSYRTCQGRVVAPFLYRPSLKFICRYQYGGALDACYELLVDGGPAGDDAPAWHVDYTFDPASGLLCRCILRHTDPYPTIEVFNITTDPLSY